MKVVYQTFLLLFFFSCASSVYRISHEHLERSPNYFKIGIWSYSAHWVELYDDKTTSWPFDEATWLSSSFGIVDYVDTVCDEGNIHRYGWNWDKKRFTEISILTLKDGENMNPFQYYDLIVNSKRIPI